MLSELIGTNCPVREDSPVGLAQKLGRLNGDDKIARRSQFLPALNYADSAALHDMNKGSRIAAIYADLHGGVV